MNKKKNYLQAETIKIIKKIIEAEFDVQEHRIIKIHGGQYQETGLPDIMILIKAKSPIGLNNEYCTPSKQLWLEIKRHWNDTPSSIQDFNITHLKRFGFITGYVVGGEYKALWADEQSMAFEQFIKEI